MAESKFAKGTQQLNPGNLYTKETRVYSQGLAEADLQKPISFGKDINGVPYTTDGNHRSKKAQLTGKPLLGRHIANGKFDVTTDPDFRPVSKLKVLE